MRPRGSRSPCCCSGAREAAVHDLFSNSRAVYSFYCNDNRGNFLTSHEAVSVYCQQARPVLLLSLSLSLLLLLVACSTPFSWVLVLSSWVGLFENFKGVSYLSGIIAEYMRKIDHYYHFCNSKCTYCHISKVSSIYSVHYSELFASGDI